MNGRARWALPRICSVLSESPLTGNCWSPSNLSQIPLFGSFVGTSEPFGGPLI